MHQSAIPSLSQTIWPRWASKQFLILPIVQTLLPGTFGYSQSSHKRTSMVPSRSFWNGTTSALQPKEITINKRRLLSIKVPIRKKSVNLFNDPRTISIIIIINARQSDLITINKKERTCRIVDFTVPFDHRVKLREFEKCDKYLDLAR